VLLLLLFLLLCSSLLYFERVSFFRINSNHSYW
jgi:hypothetical protein